MIETDEQKRDFIAEEISKRIIGPGYSQETYACDDDASDEVIDFRPNIIYTAGILFPKRVPSVSADEQSSVSLKDSVGSDQDNSEDEITEDVEDPVNDTSNLENGVTTDEDSKQTSMSSKMDSQVDISDSDRPDFEPNHIGLVMCLGKDVDKIEVDVNAIADPFAPQPHSYLVMWPCRNMELYCVESRASASRLTLSLMVTVVAPITVTVGDALSTL